MSLIRTSTEDSGGKYYGVAPSFSGTSPAAGTNFDVTAGTNSTYATFQASGAARANAIRFRVSNNLPDGVTLNPETGVLSGTEPLITSGNIGGPSNDAYGQQNNIQLSGNYGAPFKQYSFSITTEEFVPGSAQVQSTTRNYTMQVTVPYLYRQIITRGFALSGYRDAITYRNCNRTAHATDTTDNLGDQMARSYNYKAAANGHSIHYAFGASNAHQTESNYTAAFNMRTSTQFGNRMNSNTDGQNASCFFQGYYYAWLTGGNFTSGTEEFNLSTETRTSNNVADSGNSGWSWAMNGETFGIAYNGGYQRTFTMATRTYSGRSEGNPSNSDQQKAVQSKLGVAWAGGNGSYAGGFFFRKTNMITNTLQSSNIGAKPAQNTGEENLDIGQNHQYCVGTFDGAQNNRAWRWNYATDSGFEGGASMQGKGVPGRSSGTSGWVD